MDINASQLRFWRRIEGGMYRLGDTMCRMRCVFCPTSLLPGLHPRPPVRGRLAEGALPIAALRSLRDRRSLLERVATLRRPWCAHAIRRRPRRTGSRVAPTTATLEGV